MTATLTRWYDQYGRHEIFAGNKAVPLPATGHSLHLDAGAVAAGAQTDLDTLGIAKNAREEKLRSRRDQVAADRRRHDEMARLYRQHVLKEQAPPPLLQFQGLKRPPDTPAVERTH